MRQLRVNEKLGIFHRLGPRSKLEPKIGGKLRLNSSFIYGSPCSFSWNIRQHFHDWEPNKVKYQFWIGYSVKEHSAVAHSIGLKWKRKKSYEFACLIWRFETLTSVKHYHWSLIPAIEVKVLKKKMKTTLWNFPEARKDG